MTVQIRTLKLNDEVSIVRYGSWSARSEGIYVVAKADKMKVVLKRKTDGYERTFSVKTNIEKGASRYHSSAVETIADMERREFNLKREQELRNAWKTLEAAASQKNLAAADAAIELIRASVVGD